ncbi:flagellar biosynthesis regulator FlaF [Actibacterium sp. MT2.3-13A]|uniref:flagellar biosynthesis regulator FlaF n=1 Tax=Actibacterium sp. MT2.3-13A TaxID=2828332 RepID=UPI001BAB5A95|nr:flagellar biosynthesis regulator FlaF [Actibacterium sp. MT2.3-13A]
MSIAAYKQTIRESETPRQIERRILSRLTGQLEQHARAFDAAETRSERQALLAGGLRASLTENQAMWRALKHDLAAEGNALPPDMRASLLSLALWVDRQTTAVMGGARGLGALVAINRSIVAGLSGQPPRPEG